MSGERDRERDAFRERAKKLLTLDHFSALGIPRTASPAEVQKAFLEAAKTWHPDRVPSDFAELKPLVMQVFGRLDAARATLSDTTRRARYLEEIEKPSTPAKAADVAAAEASFEFKKAEALLKRNDIATAERHLRRATELAPKNADYRATLVWVKVTPTSTPPELEAVLAELDRVVAQDANNKRALFYRAQVRKRVGRAKEAHADFLRVSELDPSNIDAQREVRLFNMRKERSGETGKNEKQGPPTGEGGFLKKLFKR
jgi:curved DNA-binding protein CbpA